MAIKPSAIIIRVPESDPGPITTLLEVFVHEPVLSPNPNSKVSARPYEWTKSEPTSFAVTCPHCGQGIFFKQGDIQRFAGKQFIACTSCKRGGVRMLAPFDDPFINPLRRDTLLPPTAAPLLDLLEEGSILERMGEPSEELA